MKARRGIGVAGVAMAWLAATALTSGTASAAPPVLPPPTTCSIQFFPPPQVDDFVVHSTGWAMCTAFVSPIEGTMELLLNGTTVVSQEFYLEDVLGVGVQVRMPCVSGAYQATMTARWTSPTSGSDSLESAETPIIDITC